MSGTRASSNDRPPGSGGVKRGRLQQEAAATGSRVTVVLGAQWGDEGKGKVVDLLATDADIVSRCQVRAPQQAPSSPRTRDPVLRPGLDTPPGYLPFLDTWDPCTLSTPLPCPPPGTASPAQPHPLRQGPGPSYKYKC